MLSMAEGLAVKRRVETRLLAMPGVHTVGFGAKVTGGSPAGEFAILVYVQKKKSPAELSPAEMIQTEIDGVKTDVVEVSPVRVRRSTVVQGGDEIHVDVSNRLVGQGTLGCVARLKAADTDPPDVLLSCRHVLYPDDKGPPGEDVTIPSCSGCCQVIIGKVLDGPQINDLIDAALAEFGAGVLTKARLHDVPVQGVRDLTDPALPADIKTALQNQTYNVFKYGSRTNITHGVITDVDASGGQVDPRNHQILIQPINRSEFLKDGDSGAVVYDGGNQVVGVLWASLENSGLGVACQIKNVLAAFPGLRIAKNPPEVVYVTPGTRKLPRAMERIHRDLTASGSMEYYAGLYGKHLEEVRWLFAHSRHFVSAWHRNHGPKIARSLVDLADDRIAWLPSTFEGRSWKECINRIAGALLYAGSERLQADVTRYFTFIGALGGKSYTDMLQVMRALNMAPN